VAYLRVCSGKFERDMSVRHARSGKTVRLARPMKLFGQERETVDEAYAGDVVGLINPGLFAIGDTVSSTPIGSFPPLPRFPAEHFGRMRLQDTRSKQFDEGLVQLEEEGLMQLFYIAGARREPIVGVVGALQFDVITSRLRTEYGVTAIVGPTPYAAARWVADPARPLPALGGHTTAAMDRRDRLVLLFGSEWERDYFERQHPEVSLLAESPVS